MSNLKKIQNIILRLVHNINLFKEAQFYKTLSKTTKSHSLDIKIVIWYIVMVILITLMALW